MGRVVQMPLGFVTDVYRLIALIDGLELPTGGKDLCDRVKAQIEAKMERMDRHEAYTRYKTAKAGSSEREEARQDYLEKTRMSGSYRTTDEIPNP